MMIFIDLSLTYLRVVTVPCVPVACMVVRSRDGYLNQTFTHLFDLLLGEVMRL
ncbi:MAG: hypothetical protein VX589_16650 [Myxococcota bacterium]|nr:hypothetical protein [Myxococcota bacterium]